MSKDYYIAVKEDTTVYVPMGRSTKMIYRSALMQLAGWISWLMQTDGNFKLCVKNSIVIKFSNKQRTALGSYQTGSGKYDPFIRLNKQDFDYLVRTKGFEAAMEQVKETLRHELVHAYEHRVLGKMSPHKGGGCSQKCDKRCPNFVKGATVLFGNVRCRGIRVGNSDERKLEGCAI